MRYFKFIMPSKEEKESSKPSLFETVLEWLLEKIVPKANPDFDMKYNDVEIWIVECDEEKDSINREIGLDKDGMVIVKGPFQNNVGYWVDNNLTIDDYKNAFDVQYIDKAVFEKLWEEPLWLNDENRDRKNILGKTNGSTV